MKYPPNKAIPRNIKITQQIYNKQVNKYVVLQFHNLIWKQILNTSVI